MTDAVKLFSEIVACAIPYGVAFALGDMIVSSFMRMAFGGRVSFR